LEPEQQRIGVRGTITLRNDSDAPQQNVALQISSSLTWRSIQLGHEPLTFVSQPYTSDIDHTGNMSEALVTLPNAVPAKGVIQFTIGYEGVIRADASRLTRIGVPENAAKDTDWDVISNEFTAVRGIGYVTWYPIAAEAANLSEGSVFTTIERWKSRHRDSSMAVTFDHPAFPLFFSGVQDAKHDDAIAYTITHFGVNVPVFATADYKWVAGRKGSSVNYLSGSQDAAKAYAALLARINPPSFLNADGNLQILQLPNAEAAAFVSDSILLIPLNTPISTDAELNTVYALARQSKISERLWIQDGLAHYAQLTHIENAGGRPLVLSYLTIRRSLLSEQAKVQSVAAQHETTDSLINSGDDPKAQMKAMWVWWMLDDMCGDDAISQAMSNYQAAADKEPSYVQHLLEASCKKDLEWFFDDWVYRDKGLPDFHIASVFPRKNLKEGYLTTVTVENLGNAGAEVPVTLHDDSGNFTEKILVKGKSQGSVRFSTTYLPDEVTVNDGSVPESDFNNNTFKIEAASETTSK
ncbi:MAG TPA: hypothetical protein VLK33_19710, partial [Terriglobales bacterium]|nr:hypothetical protein [Terriglobales bacterium]